MTDRTYTPSPDFELREYRVRLRECEGGPAWYVTVKASGPNDAKGQAYQAAYEAGADRPAVIDVKVAA